MQIFFLFLKKRPRGEKCSACFSGSRTAESAVRTAESAVRGTVGPFESLTEAARLRVGMEALRLPGTWFQVSVCGNLAPGVARRTMVAADDAMLRSMAHGASPPAQPSPLRQAGDASRARRQRVRPRSSNLAACARVAFNLLLIPLLEPPASPHGTMRRRRRRRRSSGGGESKRACLEGNTHAQLHGGTPCAIGCPRSSCRTPSKSVRPRRMAPCEGGRRRRSSGGLPAAFARRSARRGQPMAQGVPPCSCACVLPSRHPPTCEIIILDE